MDGDGNSKDDVKVPDTDLGKEIETAFEDGKDCMVTIIAAMGMSSLMHSRVVLMGNRRGAARHLEGGPPELSLPSRHVPTVKETRESEKACVFPMFFLHIPFPFSLFVE